MSHAAHLYPVPDPEPEPDDETAGERAMPAPVAVPVPPLPTEPEPEPELDDDAGNDQDDVDEPEHRRRALSLPDLSPYYDVRPLKELGPLAVAAGRRGGPPLLRCLARVGHGAIIGVLCLLRGVRLLLVLLYAWMTGAIGKGGSFPARLGITAGLGYVLATAPAQHPAAPYAMAVAFLLLLVAAGTGRIPEPGSKKKSKKGGEKDRKSTGEKGQNAGKSGEKTKKNDTPEEANAQEKKVEKEKPKDAPRSGPLARLQRLGKEREKAPAVDLTKTPAGSPAKPAVAPAEESPEPADQAPADPSRDDVIRALHQLVGEGRGVLLTTLRQHLSLPDTRAVRRVLGECSITIRTGVRAEAGNGPGVHRDDVPPLPSPQGSPQGPGVVAGQTANANANNAANAPEEGMRADSNEWTAEEIAKGYRTVRHPERGPSAWKIEHHRG
ncbi:hypothetical protein [Streptomyces sulphureus]|uniref:hypothetical protein n=1 Tax=Streptomyces sulphureus TaxID=47758 RepID=UPI0003687654|nr:hypothetical protein [Streptomyces sulphureus]